MIEWYWNKETNTLDRLCTTEQQQAEMAVEIALHTEKGALLYHNYDYGIPYNTIYDDSFDLAKLKLSEAIKRSLPSQTPSSIEITRNGKTVNVSVEVVTKNEVNEAIRTQINFT